MIPTLFCAPVGPRASAATLHHIEFMAFDFNSVEVESDAASDYSIDHLLNSICDAVTYSPDFLSTLGYYIRDKYYMVNPYKYLDSKWENGGLRGVIYYDTVFISLYAVPALVSDPSPDEFILPADELEDRVWQWETLDKIHGKRQFERKLNAEAICHLPIGVFQHIKDNGTINAKPNLEDYPGGELPFDTSHNACMDDTQVFRGIYRAQKQDDGTYKLTRIFDRYYFKTNKLFKC